MSQLQRAREDLKKEDEEKKSGMEVWKVRMRKGGGKIVCEMEPERRRGRGMTHFTAQTHTS